MEHLLPLRSFERRAWTGPATLSVTADDGYQADLTELAPLLTTYGARGTFGICTSLIGKDRYLSEDELARLAAGGHEIASHMHHHVAMTDLDDTACEQDFLANEEWLRQRGLHATTLIYPFGRNSRRIREHSARHFSTALSAWPGINTGTVNAYALRRIGFGSHEHSRYPVATEPERWMDRLASDQGWMILMLHTGDPSRRPDEIARLDRLLNIAVSRGIQLRSVREAAEAGLKQA
jgi:peptidoglycan/xylan/chitin deacetylase (PgdA/CDA1 family)